MRASWLRTLYPEATVLELDDPAPDGDPEEVSAAYATHFRRHYRGAVTRVFSSEQYGERFARFLGAEHVSVDPERRHVPISATAIRRDPFRHRAFLEPIVLRSLVVKVCLVGAESTGKTTR